MRAINLRAIETRRGGAGGVSMTASSGGDGVWAWAGIRAASRRAAAVGRMEFFLIIVFTFMAKFVKQCKANQRLDKC